MKERLGHPNCRVLTIIGPGGVGKSCIARRAAVALRPQYRDGVVFVPLDALPASGPPGYPASARLRGTHAVAAMGSILDAIGNALERVAGLTTPDPAELEPLERIVWAHRDRHLLLALDNLEHLDKAATIVSSLVARCPRLDILTTSRERLDLAEECLMPIEGLAYPPPGANLAQALASPAVQLFAQRVLRVQPTFRLKHEELPHVLDVCRLVDGLPLGIELAAAWLRLLPCSAVAREIERDMDFLDVGPSDGAHRHRSIRATFEYTWTRLAPAARSALKD